MTPKGIFNFEGEGGINPTYSINLLEYNKEWHSGSGCHYGTWCVVSLGGGDPLPIVVQHLYVPPYPDRQGFGVGFSPLC